MASRILNYSTTVADNGNSLTIGNDGDEDLWYGGLHIFEPDYVPMTYDRTTSEKVRWN